MNVLILGNGAREHALIYGINRSPLLDNVFNYPEGNPIIDGLSHPLSLQSDDFEELSEKIRQYEIQLIIPGPESYLEKGVTNYFEGKTFSHGEVFVFGPAKEAASIETSKIYAREVAKHLEVPQPIFEGFAEDERDNFFDFAVSLNYNCAVKVDGLAQGKGAYLCGSEEDCENAFYKIFDEQVHGKVSLVVVEEKLEGTEIGLHVLVRDNEYVAFPISQDHKPIYPGGPNTGGMGVRLPVENVIDEEYAYQTFVEPFINYFKNWKIPFKGLFYPSLMVESPTNAKLIEVNARWGDPEAPTIIPLIDYTQWDLLEAMWACASGEGELTTPVMKPGFAVSVVLASKGYPGEYQTGEEIFHNPEDNSLAFYSGCKAEDGILLTDGGRVLEVLGFGDSRDEAIDDAMGYIGPVGFHFNGMVRGERDYLK